MGFEGMYGKQLSVAQLQAKAEKSAAKLRKKGITLSPPLIQGRTIARSWWGKAWLDNLASYADYANRLGRGRSYAVNGLVLHLAVSDRLIEAIVQGSRAAPYDVSILVDPLPPKRLDSIETFCAQRISVLDDLLSGAFPADLKGTFLDRQIGLFPSPREIRFSCSCPDQADMCKHVAAVLCGVGARLDEQPALFFLMRGIPTERLLRRSVDSRVETLLQAAEKASRRALGQEETLALFGKFIDP